jgi:hypothetical protein
MELVDSNRRIVDISYEMANRFPELQESPQSEASPGPTDGNTPTPALEDAQNATEIAQAKTRAQPVAEKPNLEGQVKTLHSSYFRQALFLRLGQQGAEPNLRRFCTIGSRPSRTPREPPELAPAVRVREKVA